MFILSHTSRSSLLREFSITSGASLFYGSLFSDNSMSLTGSKLPVAKAKKKFFDESADHIMQTYGGLIPITAADNLVKAFAWAGSIDNPSGAVFFTMGRNMYIWSIKADQKPLKKLVLPASEITVLGRHVSLAVFPRSVSLSCVTPAGCLRYWKSLSNPNGNADYQMSLKGQEVHSVIQITYEKLLVATTSCVVYFIDTNSFENREINLNSKGTLSRFSAVASYFLPAPGNLENAEEIRRVVVPAQSKELVFVASNANVYCINFMSEKVMWKNCFLQLHGSEILETCYGSGSAKIVLTNYDIKIVDAKFWSDESEIVLCISMRALRGDSQNSHIMKFAFVLLHQNDLSSVKGDNIDINIFPSKLELPLSDVENGDGRFELEIPSAKYCECILRSNNKIIHLTSMFMQNPEDVKIDIVDLSKTNDCVIAAGIHEDSFLLLTGKKGLISYTSKNPKHLREFQSLSTLQQSLKDIYENYASEPCIQLLQYFLLFAQAKSSQKRLLSLCDNYFAEISVRPDFDYLVYNCALSILDGAYNEISDFEEEMDTTDLNIPKVLAQKLNLMTSFLDFVATSGLAEKLTAIEKRSSDNKENKIDMPVVPTMVAVFSLLEFVACAESFYELHCKHNSFFDTFIRVVMENRSSSGVPNDYVIKFYKNVANFEDIFGVISLAQKIGNVDLNYENAFVIVELFKETFTKTSHCREVIGGPIGESEGHCYWNVTEDFLEYLLVHLNWIKNGPDILHNSTTSMELVQAHFDLAVVCLQSLSLFFKSIEKEADTVLSLLVESYVKKMRRAFIRFFFDVKQQMHGLALAEKFLDFETLIGTCVEENKLDKLLHYQDAFKDKHFDLYLIRWLYDHNCIKLLLSLKSPALLPFLQKTPELRWVLEAKEKRWKDATASLYSLCTSDLEMTLHKKRLLLAFAKMYCILSRNQDEIRKEIGKMMSMLEIQVRLGVLIEFFLDIRCCRTLLGAPKKNTTYNETDE